jgi:F1F0 ATPase subunit 2
MIEIVTLILTCAMGTALGGMFFGGLWWTIRRAVTSPQPALWIFSSLLLRMSIALSGFYVLSGDQWERFIACLIGFAMARLIVTWITQPMEAIPVGLQRETHRAH